MEEDSRGQRAGEELEEMRDMELLGWSHIAVQEN